MSLNPAPEADTCTHSFSERILVIAGVFYTQGILWEDSGDQDAALAAYSYGFGGLMQVSGSGFSGSRKPAKYSQYMNRPGLRFLKVFILCIVISMNLKHSG